MARRFALIAPPWEHSLAEHFWVQHWSGAPGVWRIVPDLSPHILCHARVVRGRLLSTRPIVGARSTYADVNLEGRRLTIGARLRPGALADLFGGSAATLTDRALPLGAVAERPGAALGPRIVGSEVETAVTALADFLRSRPCVPHALAAAVTGERHVGRLAEAAGARSGRSTDARGPNSASRRSEPSGSPSRAGLETPTTPAGLRGQAVRANAYFGHSTTHGMVRLD